MDGLRVGSANAHLRRRRGLGTCVADAVEVGVGLRGVGDEWAVVDIVDAAIAVDIVVAGVAERIAVLVGLIDVAVFLAVVGLVGDAIGVDIAVAGVAGAVVVRVGLVGVGVDGAVVGAVVGAIAIVVRIADVALAIAVVKAGLVSLFFMGLIHDDRFNGMVMAGALIFLSLFFVLTFPDLLYRSALDPVRGNPGTNPAAFNYKAPETPVNLNTNGHADPAMNPKRLYGGSSATGASSSTSGVLILESAGDFLPGGDKYGHSVEGRHSGEH